MRTTIPFRSEDQVQLTFLDVCSHESGTRVNLEVVFDWKGAGLASHYGAFRAPAYRLFT